MEPEHIFYIVLALFWFLSQLSGLAKKKRQREDASKRARPQRPVSSPTAAPALPEAEAQKALASLSRLEARIETGLPDLDEKSRALAVAHVERGFQREAQRVRDSLGRALSQRDAGRVYEEIARSEDLVSETERVLKMARKLSAMRRQTDVAQPLRVADRLVDEISVPLRSFAATSLLGAEVEWLPPLAVVSDRAADDAKVSPLAPSTLFVPRSVTVDPLHWSLAAHEVARYVAGIAPGLYQEMYDALSLRVTEAEIASDRDALVRLLFGAYLVRIVGDAVGASLFGTSYLRALARLYAEPESPSRVTTIYLNEDGTVYPEPPAHLRIHVTAAWLSEMGYANEAQEVARVWDERHGNPPFFSFYRSMGTLPADVVLETATELTVELYQLEIQSLAARTLASLPGVGDGTPRRREVSDAKAAFLQGARASGSARTLLAAAMDAASEAPGSATAIRNALYESVAPGPTVRKRAAARAPAARVLRARTPFRVTSREVVEALILGDVLLERRRC